MEAQKGENNHRKVVFKLAQHPLNFFHLHVRFDWGDIQLKTIFNPVQLKTVLFIGLPCTTEDDLVYPVQLKTII